MPGDDARELLALAICPACRHEERLEPVSRNVLHCPHCDARFPLIHCGNVDIPWLFADPYSTCVEWKARYNGFLHRNAAEQQRLKRALSNHEISRTAKRRITRLLRARTQHREQVTRLVAPLELESIEWPPDMADVLQSKLPKNQGLSSYYDNVFRDWAWDNGENEAVFDVVADALQAARRDHVGATLTLGAGACRLPFDVHRGLRPSLSVVLDFNPLLLHVASHVVQGYAVPLYEFPVAPLNEASFAVLQECRAPSGFSGEGFADFHFVFADALEPPFARHSFDTVITPWFIDIIPRDLRDFLPHLNRLLVEGGIWVNSGSLAFFHKDESWCYSEEEVLDLVEQSGFELLAADRKTIPYLQSPHSAHGRTENVLTFAARKIDDVAHAASRPYLPEWVLDISRPVPRSAGSAVSSSRHLLKAQILALTDGKRTIDDIGCLIAEQYGLGLMESIHAVRRILIDFYEDADPTDTASII